jgi:hypothetical protein
VSRWRAPRPRSESWTIAAVALLLRLLVVGWAAGRIPPTADGTYYQTIAERIAAGHGYTWLWPDGAVTYAAHYPIGYPALIGAAYVAFGAKPVVAMVVHAVLGALGAFAAHRILLSYGRAATLAGVLVAVHPGLVFYTPALMTEGVAGVLVLLAAWAATCARRLGVDSSADGLARRRYGALLAMGVTLGAAALVRPQLIVLAPFLGLAAARPQAKKRLISALVVTTLSFATCAPWTLRNCVRMGRCAFVSVNGGWNLLIGTNPDARGGWAPVEVPAGCRTVFDEAGKDACFGEAAKQRIVEQPLSWASLAPGKLRATFDYCGAAGWYLHQANPSAFGDTSKLTLGVVETLFERLALMAALVASFRPRWRLRHRSLRQALGSFATLLGLILAVTPQGALAHLVLTFGLGLRALRSRLRPLETTAFALLASTMLIHAAFFGGGRYQLPTLALLTVVAATGSMRRRPKQEPA